jgi:tetratricopeptide (TPR) repeat protein
MGSRSHPTLEVATVISFLFEYQIEIMGPETETDHWQDVLGKPTETTDNAEEHRLIVVDIISRHGRHDSSSLQAMDQLAGVYWGEGMRDNAIEVQRKALDWREEVDGPENNFNLFSMDPLAFMYFEEGQFQQAEKVLLQSMELRAQAAHCDSSRMFDARILLLKTYEKQGKKDDALRTLWELLELFSNAAGMEGKAEVALKNIWVLLESLSRAAGVQFTL